MSFGGNEHGVNGCELLNPGELQLCEVGLLAIVASVPFEKQMTVFCLIEEAKGPSAYGVGFVTLFTSHRVPMLLADNAKGPILREVLTQVRTGNFQYPSDFVAFYRDVADASKWRTWRGGVE